MVLKAVPWPQPGPIAIQLQLNKRASELRLRIFSRAYVLVAESLYGPAGPGWVRLDLPSAYRDLGPGTYFFRADAGGQPQDGKAGVLVKLP